MRGITEVQTRDRRGVWNFRWPACCSFRGFAGQAQSHESKAGRAGELRGDGLRIDGRKCKNAAILSKVDRTLRVPRKSSVIRGEQGNGAEVLTRLRTRLEIRHA